MKTYSKTHEDIFSVDHRKNHKLSNMNSVDIDFDQYTGFFRNVLSDFYLNIFDSSLRISWLRRKFSYAGHQHKMPLYRSSRTTLIAFSKFLRRTIGKDIQFLSRSSFFSRLETYFSEMYPGFEEGNPFENPEFYKFPYKNVSVDYMLVVYQMDDRLGLLDIAEKQNMSYARFLDYVINHAYSVNDELNYIKYSIRLGPDRMYSFFIRNKDQDKRPVRGQKRK